MESTLDLTGLPATSLLRIYDPAVQGNSFSLDGFPTPRPGGDWFSRLGEIIEAQGILGMTTNQTLFKQLAEAGVLDDRLRALKAQGRSAKESYWTLYNEAATRAAGAFRAVHERWPWEGRVSQEASALLTELEPLVQEVRRIARAMEGVGAFTKIPNLAVGPEAIRKVLESDRVVHPNITLVFSDLHYLDTVEGTLRGLSDRVDHLRRQGSSEEEIRRQIGRIFSVNSLFVSRVDRLVDPMIAERIRQTADPTQRRRLERLRGKTAVAQAKKVSQIFRAVFLEVQFPDPERLYADEEGQTLLRKIERLSTLYRRLKPFGLHPQRLLIASSGVKSDQPYSPLLYVLPFLGPWSANTMPEGTLEAVSRFVGRLSDSEAAALRKRDLMAEPLPDLPAGAPLSDWERAVRMSPQERRKEGIAEATPDQILREVRELVLHPAGASLRSLCGTLRDQGAASFAADEQATLGAIQSKLQTL